MSCPLPFSRTDRLTRFPRCSAIISSIAGSCSLLVQTMLHDMIHSILYLSRSDCGHAAVDDSLFIFMYAFCCDAGET